MTKRISIALALVLITLCLAPLSLAAGLNDVNALADDAVLVTISGRAITKADVQPVYDQMLSQYSMYGMDTSTPENQQAIFSYALSIAMQQVLLEQQAGVLGLDQFTDEELKEMTERAQTDYDSALSTYQMYFAGEGKSEEDVRAETVTYLEGMGYTADNLLKNAKEEAIFSRVFEYVTKDVNITDEDVQAAYDTRVAEAQALYDQTPGQFASDVMGGGTVYYTPEGYRTVKHILVMFDKAAELQELNATLGDMAEDDAAREETQRKIDELLAEIQPKLDEVMARVEAGEDFQALIDEYGEDGGMKSGTTAETGYYMNAETTAFVPEFTAAGMALAQVGDVSEPVLTAYGFHIIRYNSDVEAGVTPFEQLQESIRAELVQQAENTAFSAAMNEWGNAATIEYALSEGESGDEIEAEGEVEGEVESEVETTPPPA